MKTAVHSIPDEDARSRCLIKRPEARHLRSARSLIFGSLIFGYDRKPVLAQRFHGRDGNGAGFAAALRSWDQLTLLSSFGLENVETLSFRLHLLGDHRRHHALRRAGKSGLVMCGYT